MSVMRILSRPVGAMLCALGLVNAAFGADVGYRSPEAVGEALLELADQSPGSARIHSLARTPGGRDVTLIDIGRPDAELPAILVAANMEGDSPLGTLAALDLATRLLDQWRDDLSLRRWYIVPVGNPDGYARSFQRPIAANFGNARPVNADHDDATDEDGPEDLNGDGFITMMRQPHPEGEWIAVEDKPGLMRKADRAKGERGAYRIFAEGIDTDGDGEINEDGPGGVNPGHNFPHNFKHYTSTGGLWAASETESRGVMRFAYDHPEIAMVLTFGRSNNLRDDPGGSGEGGEQGARKYSVPSRYAKRMGISPGTKLPLKKITQLAREMTGNMQMSEDTVLSMLGDGAVTTPNAGDATYWKEIHERYTEFIKQAALDDERLDSAAFSPGSIEEWAYYHYGVPSFSLDFWTLPVTKDEAAKDGKTNGALTADDIEKMTNEAFIGLGEEKITAILEAHGAERFTAKKAVKAIESGMMTPKKIAEHLRKAKKDSEPPGVDAVDEALFAFDKDAFVIWESFDHPTLGPVEIGGRKPCADLAPPPEQAAALIDKQLPFVRELAKRLPEIAIDKVNVEPKGPNVWRVEVWVTNKGFLPYPTHHGMRCKRPTPVSVTLGGEAVTLLEGRPRRVLGLLEGSGGTGKLTWVIHAKAGQTVTLKVHGLSTGRDQREITLGGGAKQ